MRILTGSLLNTPADYQRGISVHFTVVDNPVGPVATDPKIALTRASAARSPCSASMILLTMHRV